MAARAAQQEFWTARELAEIAAEAGLTSFPQSERRVRDLAVREGWDGLPERLARRRIDPAGGRPSLEYHVSLLPERLQMVLHGRAVKARATAVVTSEADADRRRMAALRATALAPRARTVMEARAEILLSIDGYAVAHGQTRAWAIARYLEAQDAHAGRQEIEAARDRGENLTPREISALTRPLLLTSHDGFHLVPERIAQANDRRARPIVKRRTIYDWFKARDEHGVVALAPEATKAVQPIPEAFGEFLRFYAVPSKPSVSDAHGEYVKEAAKREGAQPMTLTLSQVRHILTTRLNSIERNVGREGLLTLRSRMAYVTRTTEDMWPTTIYSADGKTFDAEIADPVTKAPIRPEITTVIDVVTRKITGISLARSENQRSVAEALRNACMGGGIPAIFYVDRGPGYRNDAMDADVSGLMGRLHITKMHAAPYGSQAKGRIERPNATVWDTLAKRLPTYIGADMDREAGQKVHKLTRRELKAFGQSHSLPSWEQFVDLCYAMVDEYNAKPHRGLAKFEDPKTGRQRHMSPDEAWAAHVASGFEPVTVEAEEADDLFRPYEIRTVRRGLVQWNTNQYFDPALEAYHEERVMVGYDYHQADRVWVREFDVESGQPGKLICVARFGGNAERYVAWSYEQKALENRTKGRLRRVDAKRSAIEAERDAVAALEFQPANPAPFVDIAPREPEPLPSPALAPAARRRVFRSDEELAAWALQHPTELTTNQIRVLRDCITDSTARKVLEMAGIDTEALRTLLRAAA